MKANPCAIAAAVEMLKWEFVHEKYQKKYDVYDDLTGRGRAISVATTCLRSMISAGPTEKKEATRKYDEFKEKLNHWGDADKATKAARFAFETMEELYVPARYEYQKAPAAQTGAAKTGKRTTKKKGGEPEAPAAQTGRAKRAGATTYWENLG